MSNLRSQGRVVLLNDAAKFAPGDVLFTADSRWIVTRAVPSPSQNWVGWANWIGEEIIFAVSRYHRREIKTAQSPLKYILRMYYEKMHTGLDGVSIGGNSGFAALNLALLKRAKLIYLLGYDMNTGPHQNWHVGYAEQKRVSNAYYYTGWAKLFEKTAAQVRQMARVVNLNPESAIRCFEMGKYADVGL